MNSQGYCTATSLHKLQKISEAESSYTFSPIGRYRQNEQPCTIASHATSETVTSGPCLLSPVMVDSSMEKKWPL